MKIILIIAICLVVIATIIVVWGILTKWKFVCKKKDNYEKNKPKALSLLQKGVEDSQAYYGLGNKLGAYFFYNKNNPVSQGELYWCYIFCSEQKFFNDTNIKKYINLIKNALPRIKKELAQIKPDKSVKNDAVIHIRCSDVPFNRHNSYHLQPEAYYKWIADICKQENIKTIHILSCTNHRQSKTYLKYKCKKIAQTIQTCMKKFLPNVEIKPAVCLNILKSYQMFLGCKILAQGGAGPSSFTLFPGLTKGKNFLTPKFISEKLKQKSNILDKWIDKFPWSMWRGDPVWHSSVKEYYSKPSILAVSAYFPLDNNKSKSNSSQKKFLQDFKNSTLFHVDYSIFGPRNIINEIKKIRSYLPYKTITNPMTLNEFVSMCKKEFGNDVLERLAKHTDPNHCPSAELMLIWLGKILFVKKEIENNPYYTHFGWLDAGYKTHRENPPLQKPWPCKDLNKIPKEKIVVKRKKNGCHPQYWDNKVESCPVGCCWFGDTETCKIFINECIKEIKKRLYQNKSLCIDQDLMEIVGKKLDIFYDVGEGTNYGAIFLD